MGALGSKNHLERRNTVLRRSQRKSIHGVKSKLEKLVKDINKFKGVDENDDYTNLKVRIEQAEKELKHHAKNLQSQVNYIYSETLKKTQECHTLLRDKLKQNQEKEKKVVEKNNVEEHEDEDDDVFIEEVSDDVEEPEERKTVEVKVIQVQPIEESPQMNKRFSAMKIGVPVLPGTIMESIIRKADETNLQSEQKIAEIRQQIEKIEVEISEFVGRRNGKHYNVIIGKLKGHTDELNHFSSTDDDIQEQVNRCKQYIESCMSFLNDKAVDDEEEEENERTKTPTGSQVNGMDTLSPRSIRTTFI